MAFILMSPRDCLLRGPKRIEIFRLELFTIFNVGAFLVGGVACRNLNLK